MFFGFKIRFSLSLRKSNEVFFKAEKKGRISQGEIDEWPKKMNCWKENSAYF